MIDKIDVLRLAREAGIPSVLLTEVGLIPADDAVFRFAALVMEECAKVCESLPAPEDSTTLTHIPTLETCAAAIRAAKPKG